MKIDELNPTLISKKEVFVYMNKKNNLIEKRKISSGSIPPNSGYYLIPGKIELMDKTLFDAILGVSSDDSGELFEVYFWLNGKYLSQKNKDFLKKIKKTKDKIFPYKYHLNIKVMGDTNRSHQF